MDTFDENYSEIHHDLNDEYILLAKGYYYFNKIKKKIHHIVRTVSNAIRKLQGQNDTRKSFFQ